MRRILVRYRVHPDRVAENEQLVKQVYVQLAEARPAGLRYATIKLADGVTFLHQMSAETPAANEALRDLPAFKAFTAGIKERCAELPVTEEVVEIGRYG
jgi:hypothetical protein